MHFLLLLFLNRRVIKARVVNSQTSPNARIKKPRNESGSIRNKHGSGGTALSRIRGSALIDEPDCNKLFSA